MAIYFKAVWWLISGIESGISWVGNQSCPFPQRRCCRRIKKFLETSVSEDLNMVLVLSNLGFWFSWREKHTKSFFFYPPWLQASVSLILAPTLFFSFSMFGNVPAAKNSSTLSCNSANSLFFVSSICAFSCHQELPPNSIRFCKLARQKRQKVFPKCTDSGSSRSFPLLPWKHLFCKGKGNMHSKSTLEDACTRRECSAICPLKQFFSPRERRNRCTTKALWKMHA